VAVPDCLILRVQAPPNSEVYQKPRIFNNLRLFNHTVLTVKVIFNCVTWEDVGEQVKIWFFLWPLFSGAKGEKLP
jgi:hypothetical protein